MRGSCICDIVSRLKEGLNTRLYHHMERELGYPAGRRKKQPLPVLFTRKGRFMFLMNRRARWFRNFCHTVNWHNVLPTHKLFSPDFLLQARFHLSQ